MLNDLAHLDLEGAQVQAPASGREEKTRTAQFSHTRQRSQLVSLELPQPFQYEYPSGCDTAPTSISVST
jgi:hypothetical protein